MTKHVLTVALVAALVGCGGNDQQQQQQAEQQANELGNALAEAMNMAAEQAGMQAQQAQQQAQQAAAAAGLEPPVRPDGRDHISQIAEPLEVRLSRVSRHHRGSGVDDSGGPMSYGGGPTVRAPP